MLPVIYGLSGLTLTDDERAFFRDADPLGYILFGRNVGDRAQLRALTDDLRSLSSRDDLPILIDQEGGRVARMRPPVWPDFPAGPAFARLYEKAPISAIEAARVNAQAIGLTLAEVGITVDCLPLLDVVVAETTPAIAERAYGSDPMQVAAIGRAVLDGLAAAGVIGVVKHMPGHGRALVDSHHELPRVAADATALEADIAPFAALAHAPMGMTCHVVFEAWDAERPATLSPTVIGDVIRERIGFDGLLMTDDIDMKALSGSAGDKAAAALAAGCDVALDCWARMDEMTDIAGKVAPLGAEGRTRLDRAMASRTAPEGDLAECIAKRDALLALA
ncbi:glycoside hydrolase family 3 N-terminal domain-containing protein [Sphingomonas baiyangensis]|uniref:beta-N-acetylhexosaminidase n=1 Tax=Sphingomonas baiyangensis TaxID=2572576 RepID=A0A4U1L523_9SPHN|nr:glycoside hydrolase family 3 N-terminal domain-containing protein [Sphingomonas baiyangensis]TKD51383.1 glycoside hydrolase family 3 protein [Sphingomonas baiyangensis]